MPGKRPLIFMPDRKSAITNIALVGGGDLCIELIEKTTTERNDGKIYARIVAVADPDPQSPGMVTARKWGLHTVSDYHELYNPEYDINLIILLVEDDEILADILNSRPANIRIMSQSVFQLFWEAIGREERKLRERNREVEAIINGIQDFILVITPDMRIVDVNEAFLNGMEYSRREVLGRKCHEVFQKASQQCSSDAVVCPLNTVLRNKAPSQSVMTRLNKRGQLRYIETTIYPIWEQGGRIREFIEISRDITDRKKQEEEITRRLEKLVDERTRQLKETHDQLIHQDKMASLGKLAASVVHEINNPNAGLLNLILLMKRIIKEGPVADPELAQFSRYLDLMETENRRVSRIVSNLLAFSRQSKMILSSVDINQLIEKTLLLTANMLKIHGVKVEKDLDPDLPKFSGSDDQLQQVFMNLVSNAAEALEASKDAVLKIRTMHSTKTGAIRVTFTDNGIGVPEAHRNLLFEPFFTTKKKGKGVGLGLSVAYGIVQEHGGTIRVTSEKEGGTSFCITLPLTREDKTGEVYGGRQNPNRG